MEQPNRALKFLLLEDSENDAILAESMIRSAWPQGFVRRAATREDFVGALELGGFVSYRQGLLFDITAKGKEIRLRYPPGVSAGANLDLRYTGTPQSAVGRSPARLRAIALRAARCSFSASNRRISTSNRRSRGLSSDSAGGVCASISASVRAIKPLRIPARDRNCS